MARASWLDDTDAPQIDAHLSQLEHFVDSMADGVIDTAELERQGANLAAAMKAVEGDLDDAQHAKVTALLAELTAFNVMKLLHELAAERARHQFRG